MKLIRTNNGRHVTYSLSGLTIKEVARIYAGLSTSPNSDDNALSLALYDEVVNVTIDAAQEITDLLNNKNKE